MPGTRHFQAALFSVLGTLLLVLGGCDNSIEPFAEKGAYSIYGFLSLSRSQQLVRVKPLEIPITKVDSNSIDATVTLENVTAGTSEVLRDSVIAYRDSESTIFTHNFWTESPIAPNTKYRITVKGRGEQSVQATTVTPTDTDADVTPELAACRGEFTVVFTDVTDRRNVRAWVEIKVDEHVQKQPWVSLRRRSKFKTKNGNVGITFRASSLLSALGRTDALELQRPEIPDSLNPFCWRSSVCAMLDSDEIRVRYLYLGPDWHGNVPEDSLTYDPLESNDVQNGLGFFGSVRRDRGSTTVDTSSFIWTGGPGCGAPPSNSFQ